MLCAGLVATILVLWITRAYVIPRYVSFLLVPAFVLLASGASSIFGRIRARPAIVRTLVCLVVIGVLGVRFATIAPDVVRLPREANRDAAEVIEQNVPASTPVFAYVRLPENISFYLRTTGAAARRPDDGRGARLRQRPTGRLRVAAPSI